MLDDVRGRIDNAGNNDFIGRKPYLLEDGPLVLVPRIGALERDRTDLGMKDPIDDFPQGDIVIVGAFIVAPTQMKSNPISISTFPPPSDKDYLGVGGHFGPHNVYENRPGCFVSSELIFATYQNAGLRVYDIRDQFRPKEVGAFVPARPTT